MAILEGKNPQEALLEGNKHNRDKSRSPMQWNANAFAGFSNNKTWIKINSDYKEVNVQNLAKNKNSILSIYKELIALHNQEKVLQYGSYDKLEYKENQISFTRSFEGDTITVIINFGNKKTIKLQPKSKILIGDTVLKQNGFLIYRN